MPSIEIYKRTQGKWTRLCTFVGVVGVGVIGAYALSRELINLPIYAQFGIPTLVILGVAALMFWIVNRPKTADFLIATEGEMKKVSWSSKKEIIGSTKVVLVTTIIMSMLLFGVDLLFIRLFEIMGIIPSGQ
ncbi:MAG: preprotein translocase subunit SecE [Planctomycetaceae bacterium]|nr:MAG: preprotein translocase subunit SecE [Planctomycetaceae bacterium]